MLDIRSVAIFSDNYIYLLHDPDTGETAVVDPGQATPALEAARAEGWRISHILLTHGHRDHTGGVTEIVRLTGASVHGYRTGLRGGECLAIGRAQAQVLATPGHTQDHLAFWFAKGAALFCGDALFSLGCGRIFVGTPAQFWASMQALRALPDETRVYCAHEYTLENLGFARFVDPDNPALGKREREAMEMLARTGSSLPSSLGMEKAANPFLRADDPRMGARLGLTGADPARVFAELRAQRDEFE